MRSHFLRINSGFLRCNLFLVKMLWKCWNDNKGFRILCKQYNNSRVWDNWLQFWKKFYCGFRSVQFSRSVVSDSLRHGSQHARPPCPSPSPEFTQTHVHRVGDATQPSHPLSSPFPPVKYYQTALHATEKLFTKGRADPCGKPHCCLILRNCHSHSGFQQVLPWSISSHKHWGKTPHHQKD